MTLLQEPLHQRACIWFVVNDEFTGANVNNFEYKHVVDEWSLSGAKQRRIGRGFHRLRQSRIGERGESRTDGLVQAQELDRGIGLVLPQLCGQLGDYLAREFAAGHGLYYVHAYDDPAVVAGQWSKPLELDHA